MMSVTGHMHSLPLLSHYIENGTVAFSRKGDFPTIFDNSEQGLPDGVSAIISNQHMLVGDLALVYNTPHNYKNMPELLSWLQQQNLQSPI